MAQDTDEEAIIRRRFDEWTFKAVTIMAPIIVVIVGWAFALQGKIETIDTKVAERGFRLDGIDKAIDLIEEELHNPSPKALQSDHDKMDARLDRIEERLANLHNYMMALPVRPSPYKMMPANPMQQRGDLKDFLKGQL